MGGWVNGWVDGWMDGYIDRYMDGYIDGYMDRWMVRWIHACRMEMLSEDSSKWVTFVNTEAGEMSDLRGRGSVEGKVLWLWRRKCCGGG